MSFVLFAAFARVSPALGREDSTICHRDRGPQFYCFQMALLLGIIAKLKKQEQLDDEDPVSSNKKTRLVRAERQRAVYETRISERRAEYTIKFESLQERKQLSLKKQALEQKHLDILRACQKRREEDIGKESVALNALSQDVVVASNQGADLEAQ